MVEAQPIPPREFKPTPERLAALKKTLNSQNEGDKHLNSEQAITSLD